MIAARRLSVSPSWSAANLSADSPALAWLTCVAAACSGEPWVTRYAAGVIGASTGASIPQADTSKTEAVLAVTHERREQHALGACFLACEPTKTEDHPEGVA